jgi:hypothetical protein
MALNVGAFVAMRQVKQREEERKKSRKPSYDCSKCSHVGAETTHDVACCNCCENGDFYDEVEEVEDRYTLNDLGNNWW